MKWFKRVDEKPELVYCKKCHLKAVYSEAVQRQRCPRCNFIGKEELPSFLKENMGSKGVVEKVAREDEE